MLEIFTTIASNLGVGIENLILIVAWLGGLIYAAKDFRIATIYWFIISGGVFLWTYTMFNNGQPVNYTFSLTLFLISLVVMSLNLLFIRQNAEVVI